MIAINMFSSSALPVMAESNPRIHSNRLLFVCVRARVLYSQSIYILHNSSAMAHFHLRRCVGVFGFHLERSPS